MILIPVYWGEWWIPAQGNSYSWASVNGLMQKVVSGRYMDGLNQYGIGRGSVSGTYVYPVDPPTGGFSDSNMQWMLKMAIDQNHVGSPDAYDLSTQQPFYCLIVKPGIEHLRDATPTVAQWTPDVQTAGYHFGFTYNYVDGRGIWNGQACWIKADTSDLGTVQRWVHEMAEAYSSGYGEIADKCEGNAPILVDGVAVPQYWSDGDNACWPLADEDIKFEPLPDAPPEFHPFGNEVTKTEPLPDAPPEIHIHH